MGNAHEEVVKKVARIFAELAGQRAGALDPAFPSPVTSTVANALKTNREFLLADEIAFHVTDWQGEAAFLVALHLFPERFTAEEIDAGVDMLLIHVPHHILAATRLAGYPAEDIFKGDDQT